MSVLFERVLLALVTLGDRLSPKHDEVVVRTGPDFDDLLVQTVRLTYPAHEQEQFLAHFRGLTGLWASDEGARLAAGAAD